MNTVTLILSALSFCYAVDPAAEQTTEKATKRWLKDTFIDLTEAQLKELGTVNKMVCGMILNEAEYVGEPMKHKARYIRGLNFECAAQIAEKNPDVLNEILVELNGNGRAAFFKSFGLDKVCPAKSSFSKLDSKLTKAVEDACKDFKPTKTEAKVVPDKNSAAFVEASIAAILLTSIAVIALA